MLPNLEESSQAVCRNGIRSQERKGVPLKATDKPGARVALACDTPNQHRRVRSVFWNAPASYKPVGLAETESDRSFDALQLRCDASSVNSDDQRLN
jgi:hypothetical protein